MKALIFLLLSLPAFAAHFAVISHGALGTEAVPLGIPTNWPARVQPIVGTNLPAQYPAEKGWVVMTGEQLAALKASLAAEKEAWNQAQEEKDKPGTVWTRREFVARVTTQEWKAFKKAAATNETAEMMMDILQLSTQIEQKNPETRQMLLGLVQLGVLASTNRVDEILDLKKP